jgi:hypothetical protein
MLSILLVGFAGAFRRSELAAMEYKQIKIGEHGAVIRIPRSKTDQEGSWPDDSYSTHVGSFVSGRRSSVMAAQSGRD